MKLMMIDLDGTLFDTKEVNYLAYKEALNQYGYDLDYKYYCEQCNGRHYTDFLPKIAANDPEILLQIHNEKKEKYKKYLGHAKINHILVDFIKGRDSDCKAAVITTASKKNTYDILSQFELVDIFDLILTQEDIVNTKPNPEGYLRAMSFFSVDAAECVIFEDSDVGIEAAQKTGATVFVAKGYN